MIFDMVDTLVQQQQALHTKWNHPTISEDSILYLISSFLKLHIEPQENRFSDSWVVCEVIDAYAKLLCYSEREVSAEGRNGKNSTQNAFNGTSYDNYYYQTPIEFYGKVW